MFAAISPTAGTQPFNDWFVPDTTQKHPLGFEVTATDPFWGVGKFTYVKSFDAILKGSLVVVSTATPYMQAILLPNTANTGFPVYVAMNNMPTGTFGWVQSAGLAVVKTNATVATSAALGIGAAGIAGTNTAGKQILGSKNLQSATFAVTFTATTKNASYVLKTTGYDGMFLGMALSGTGIPVSTVVAKLDADGQTVYMGSAIGTVGDKLATADGTITLTGTYTGYGLVQVNNPFVQGAIT